MIQAFTGTKKYKFKNIKSCIKYFSKKSYKDTTIRVYEYERKIYTRYFVLTVDLGKAYITHVQKYQAQKNVTTQKILQSINAYLVVMIMAKLKQSKSGAQAAATHMNQEADVND